MNAPRRRMTIRYLMLLVLIAGCLCGQWSCLQRWEARRALLYQQRDLTRSVLSEAMAELASSHPITHVRPTGYTATATSRWTEQVEMWGHRDGREVPVVRLVVTGVNGRFGLRPIAIEADDAPLNAIMLDRLTRAYRERGWRHRGAGSTDP